MQKQGDSASTTSECHISWASPWFHFEVNSALANIAVNGNTGHDIDLQLVTLSGKTTDSNGTPVANVNVAVRDQITWTADGATYTIQATGYSGKSSDVNGSYSVVLLPYNSYSIIVIPPSNTPFTSKTFNGQSIMINVLTNYMLGKTIAEYPLVVSKAGTGKGAVSSAPSGISCISGLQRCSWNYDTDTSISLTATPDNDSTFVGWSGLGCTGAGSCTVLMDASKGVTATFAAKTTILTVTFSGTGAGTVTSDPAGIACTSDTCQAQMEYGSVSLLPTPAAGSYFAGWSGACDGAGGCTVALDGAKSVTATFSAAPKAMVGAKKFDSVQAAYDDDATMDDAEIKLLEGISIGPFIGMRNISIFLEGGYNAMYEAMITDTTISGSLKIRSGAVRGNRINIR